MREREREKKNQASCGIWGWRWWYIYVGHSINSMNLAIWRTVYSGTFFKKINYSRCFHNPEDWQHDLLYWLLRPEPLRGLLDKFLDFFVWTLLLIVHTWNSSPLRSNLLRLLCTCCTVPTTSGRPHRSPFVWACQWPSSQPISSPQLSPNDSLWA